MECLFGLILVWFLINLALTLFLYQSWYYERHALRDNCQLENGTDRLHAPTCLKVIITETLAFMAMQLCYPWSLWRDKHQPELPDDNTTPVLLVHGYACNSSCMLLLKRRLEQAGFTRVRAVSYTPPTGNVHKLVPQVKQHIQDLLDDTGADKIHYVAHSMGGLLIRDALQDAELSGAIDKVVCLGSPHHGSRAADIIAPFTPGAVRQMQYQSDYIRSLPPTPGKARYYSIHSQMDDLVLPVNSAVVDGMTHFTVDYLGHCSLLYSASVATQVVHFLNED